MGMKPAGQALPLSRALCSRTSSVPEGLSEGQQPRGGPQHAHCAEPPTDVCIDRCDLIWSVENRGSPDECYEVHQLHSGCDQYH